MAIPSRQPHELSPAAAHRRRTHRPIHPDQTQLTTWYTERAVKFIEQNKDRPFFLYVPHSMPHVPLHVSAKHKDKSGAGLYGDVIMEIDSVRRRNPRSPQALRPG